MDSKKVLDAIGSINDEFILECIKAKPVKKILLYKNLAAAACLCIIVSSLALIPILNKQFFNNKTPTVIWGDSQGRTVNESLDEVAKHGEITYTTQLTNAIVTNTNKNVLFAVCLNEMSGLDKNYIYLSFIKPLGIKEDYMNSGILYLSEKQISNLNCPPELTTVLSLANVDDYINEKITADSKLSNKLLNLLKESNDDDLISVSIHISNKIDWESIEKEAIKNSGLSTYNNTLLNTNNLYISNYSDEKIQNIANSSRSKLSAERCILIKNYYHNMFYDLLNYKLSNQIIVHDQYVSTPFISHALLTKKEIQALSKNDAISYMDYYSFNQSLEAKVN